YTTQTQGLPSGSIDSLVNVFSEQQDEAVKQKHWDKCLPMMLREVMLATHNQELNMHDLRTIEADANEWCLAWLEEMEAMAVAEEAKAQQQQQQQQQQVYEDDDLTGHDHLELPNERKKTGDDSERHVAAAVVGME